MPPVKRYFHCSQEIIADPEIWEMINEFGDRFILTWIQILIYLERTDNQWRLTGDWLAVLSRSVRQSSAKVRRQVGQLVAKEWLLVGEVAADGSPLVLKGRNWLKYNKSRYTKKDSLQTASGIDTSPLRSVPFPSVPKEEEEEEKKGMQGEARSVQKRSRAALCDVEWVQGLKDNPVYTGIDIDLEYKKASAWYPAHNRQLTRRAFVNWLIREMGNKPMVANKDASTCQERVQRGAFLKPCGEPSVVQIGGQPRCQTHKEAYESRISRTAT